MANNRATQPSRDLRRNALEKRLRALESQAQALERKPKRTRKEENNLWDDVKEIVGDLYSAGKKVATDIGLNPKDLGGLLLGLL